MSYIKTTWNSGDVITAEKLNNIESGVEAASSSGSESGPLIVHTLENDSWHLNVNYNDVKTAVEAGRSVIYDSAHRSDFNTSYSMLTDLYGSEGNYTVHFGSSEYYAGDPDDPLTVPD